MDRDDRVEAGSAPASYEHLLVIEPLEVAVDRCLYPVLPPAEVAAVPELVPGAGALVMPLEEGADAVGSGVCAAGNEVPASALLGACPP